MQGRRRNVGRADGSNTLSRMPRDADHQLVFVVGLHRSGTSILARCLAAHPEISGLSNTGVPQDEGQHLQTVFPTAKQLGGFGGLGFNPPARLTGASGLATEESRRRLFDAWSPYWDLSKPVLLEKSPP